MPIQADRQLAHAFRLFQERRLPEAEAMLRDILRSPEAGVDAFVLAGVVAVQTSRLDDATLYLERALAIEPNRYDALVWLANVRKAQSNFEAAIALLERALPSQPTDASALTLLGTCLLSVGRRKEAESRFREALILEPRSAQGFFNLGLALRMQNRSDEALEAFRQAAHLDPSREENIAQVAKQFQRMSRWSEALETLKEGRERLPNAPVLTEALAAAYGRLNQPEQAEAIFRESTDAFPSIGLAHAKWLQEQGRFAESIDVLKSLAERLPLETAAYRELSEVKAFRLGSGTLLERALAIDHDPRLGARGRMQLCYALAKCYEAEQDYEQAMRFYDRANELAYANYPATRMFDAAKAMDDSKRLAGVYSPDLISAMQGEGSESQVPIFIVGMIRSGTTLLDQIVSRHPLVTSAGEQQFWNERGDEVHLRWDVQPDARDLHELCEDYLAVLGEVAPDARRITDKMPLNFRHLGLIACAFPRAKILHMKRDPVDTALSIYTTFFAGGPYFAYRQANIVAFYRAYESLMRHWRAVLAPTQFYELRYEDLVADPEATVRGVIEFCGLPWDDACLTFHESRAQVSTPSRWQARQPLYRSSVGRWRRFEPWLGELSDLNIEPS